MTWRLWALHLNWLRIYALCAAPSLEILSEVIGNASLNIIGLGIEDVNHELYGGLYSQMLYGEDFEEPANTSGVSGDFGFGIAKISPTWEAAALPAKTPIELAPSYETVTSGVFNGKQSQLLIPSRAHPAQIVNRGLYRQGLHFKEGLDYEGYVYARVSKRWDSSSPKLEASLFVDQGQNGSILAASQTFQLHDSAWTRLNFVLKPSRTSACHVDKHVLGCLKTREDECLRCDGSFSLAVSGGAVAVDFAFLQPGSWGRLSNLPVRLDVASMLRVAGINTLRLGGSMCNVDDYLWKNMRGPREHRQPYQGLWHPYASQGFRIFEFLDLCEHLGFRAVITLNSDELVEDLADLVEYAYGNANTTWGSLRHRDGHSKPYAPFVVEIGNEQQLDYKLVRAVSEGAEAMRVRAQTVGMDSRKLKFAIGNNLDMDMMNTPICDAMIEATKYLGSKIMWDFHVMGDSPEQVDHWISAFEMALKMLDRLGSKMKLAVFEENAQEHDIVRGMSRARYANLYARLADRFEMATAANGLQVLGFNDNGWDQGALFMGPDRAWLSPFGVVDQLLSYVSQPIVLQTRLDDAIVTRIDALGMRSSDLSVFGLRLINYDTNRTETLALSLPSGYHCAEVLINIVRVPPELPLTTVNPPSNMTLVAPHQIKVDKLSTWSFPPMSLTAIEWRLCNNTLLFV